VEIGLSKYWSCRDWRSNAVAAPCSLLWLSWRPDGQLVFAYRVVLPLFGVLSPVTWSISWACWLWVIGVPAVLAAAGTVKRAWHQAAIAGPLTVIAVIGMLMVRPPALNPDSQFHRHRQEFARLAKKVRSTSRGYTGH
jgi:hypothetical protein